MPEIAAVFLGVTRYLDCFIYTLGGDYLKIPFNTPEAPNTITGQEHDSAYYTEEDQYHYESCKI